MSVLRIYHFNCLFLRSCRSFCYRKMQIVNHSRNLTNFKIQCKQFLVSIPHSSPPRYSYIFEALYSSKLNREKPVNLESPLDYEKVSEETLQSLYDRFEELLEDSHYEDWDVNYSNGVLTITLEANFVYVINKQTPNRQIWLSSPKSGPKRYDYENGTWVYKHDGISLHRLLSSELTELLQKKADFLVCTYSS